MAFTRKGIREIVGEACTEEIENQLMALHLSVVDPLKDDVAKYKPDAEKLSEVQKELDELKAGDYKSKYEQEHSDFAAYKKDVETKETTAKKTAAYKNLLKDAGVSEKRIDAILKVTHVDDLQFGDDGAVKDADKIKESIKTEWADFITTEGVKGADTHTPPENNGGDDGQLSRAAQVAQKHYEAMYGKKGENK